jgi:hypothetical protein
MFRLGDLLSLSLRTDFERVEGSGCPLIRASLPAPSIIPCGIFSFEPSRGANQTETTVGARFVVDATGRDVWFARGQGARPVVVDRLIGFSRVYSFEPRCAPQNSYVMVDHAKRGGGIPRSFPMRG